MRSFCCLRLFDYDCPAAGKHCHEFALRLVLACLSAHAARYKRYITPIVSCSMDFYIRHVLLHAATPAPSCWRR